MNNKETLDCISRGIEFEKKGEYSMAWLEFLTALANNNVEAETIICKNAWIEERRYDLRRNTLDSQMKRAFEIIMDSAVNEGERGAQYIVSKILDINSRYFDVNLNVNGMDLSKYSDSLDFSADMISKAREQGLDVSR